MSDPTRPDDCPPLEIPPSARPLSASSRREGAWVVDTEVVRAISAAGHDPGHPFYVATEPSVEERADLLRIIAAEKPDGVLPVSKVCPDYFVSPLLDGVPLQDFGLGRDANRLIHPSERRRDWPPGVLESLLADLADGLAHLHRIGVAHGDPALMNAFVVTPDDTPRGVWIDLNSVRPADAETVATDVAGFIATCMWPALLDAKLHSPSLFEDLAASAAAGDALVNITASLRKSRRDHVEVDPRPAFIATIAAAIDAGSPDERARRRVESAMAPMYFLDQTRSDQTARFLRAVLDTERIRNRLVEEERTRLQHHRFSKQIDELRSWSDELRDAVDYHRNRAETAQQQAEAARHRADDAERRAAELQRTLADAQAARDEAAAALARTQGKLLDSTRQLEDARSRLGHMSARAARAEAGRDRLKTRLDAISASKAWKVALTLRRIRVTAAKVIGAPLRGIRALVRRGDSPAGESRPVEEEEDGTEAESGDEPARYPVSVSVIMPVYDKGRGVLEAVRSVIRQTLQDFEIIIWDDGSTDDETLAAIEQAGSFDQVQVHRTANQGVVGARNAAMRVARGEFFCCLDPDDELSPTYLEKAVAVLRSGTADIAYPWQQTVGTREVLWRTHDLDPHRILKYNHVPVCAVFHRRVFAATGGFSTAMSGGYEDWELWAHAAELGFVGKVIPEPLFHYTFDDSEAASRDAAARRRHDALVATIAELHPRLREGTPAPRPTPLPAAGPVRTAPRFEPGKAPSVLVTLPWFTVGGADRVVETLVAHWSGEGRTVVVLTTLPLGTDMQDMRADLFAATPYVYDLPTLCNRDEWLDFASAALAALVEPTLVNVGSPWFFTVAEELKNRHREVRFIDQQFNDIGHLDANRASRSSIDVTVAAYESLAEKLRSDGRPSEAVETVYVGIEPPVRPEPVDISEFRRNLGVDSGRLVAFVGRLSPEKRPQWVTRLADAFTGEDVTFLVVGDGPLAVEMRPEIEARRRVVWLEHVEKIEPALAAADLVVLPSQIEGIPLVAMEALALGTPVVATRVGGLPDLAVPGVSLVDPDDFEAFAIGVKAALSSPAKDVSLPERFGAPAMLAGWERIIRR